MSEERTRVPTWGEIFKVEAAIEAMSGALAELGRIAPIVECDESVSEPAQRVVYECGVSVRWFRAWVDKARTAREAADLERKKAGLL